MVELIIIVLVAVVAVGLGWLLCYGGVSGPVDWVMHTTQHGPRARRSVALTFDDGPDPGRTPALLDALAELDCKATFFCCGANVDAEPALARRIAGEGHELGNHTYTHRYLPTTRAKSVEKELRLTDRAIEKATGVTPRVARPPWGGRSPWNVRVFRRLAKRVVLWDVNSRDWRGAPASEVCERVLARAKPGSIILMHDGGREGATTVDAVKLIVPALRERGYEVTTVSGIAA